MISAAEARQIVGEIHRNKLRIARSLERIDELIRGAVKKGVYEVAWTGEPEAYQCVEERQWAYAAPTEYQQLVIDQLIAQGYTAELEKEGASYVPRGLQRDDGTGPAHVTLQVAIKWYPPTGNE